MATKKFVSLFLFLGIIFASSFGHSASAATAQEIKDRYDSSLQSGQKVKILIVPGHDDEYWGTEFRDTREADVVVAIGQYLYDYLKNDPRLDITIVRTQKGYADIFKNYFTENRQAIIDFYTSHISAYREKVTSGAVQKVASVPHNKAPFDPAFRLYGINKWADENNIDIVLHLHINDHGGRKYNKVGNYEGISIYIPEKQYANASTSAVVGRAIFDELAKNNPVSNLPAESAGLLEDQDLIAIGASGTLKNAASALIEYGYIYEEQYENLDMREIYVKDLAFQTFLGVHSFFGDREKYAGKYATPLLPYSWKKDLKKGLKNNADVLALQSALRNAGVFPAVGYTKYSCALTGTFGPCTEKAVKEFQNKYKIQQTGYVGPQTRAQLNTLYSK